MVLTLTYKDLNNLHNILLHKVLMLLVTTVEDLEKVKDILV
jgi:hypothetical protein